MIDQTAFRILLIEDSPSYVKLALGLLRKGLSESVSIETATELAGGLECLSKGEVDVVLLDLMLPDSSGFETFRIVKDRARDIPIVILSGVADEDLAVEAVRQGAQDYLVKGRFDADSLGRCIRFALERGRRITAERALRGAEEQFRLARRVQQRLFPAASPTLPGFDIAGAAFPAEATGGDYFDYLLAADNRVGIVVGDVSGHGLGSAILMAQTHAYLRALSQASQDLGEILTRANQLLVDHTSHEHYVTLFFAQIDPSAGLLEYAAAGHKGFHLNANGESTTLNSTGMVLGLEREARIACAPSFSLQPRDIVVLMTDGFSEARSPSGDIFGRERSLDIVRKHSDEAARSIIHRLYREVREFSREAPQTDDMTTVVIKVEPAFVPNAPPNHAPATG
jgi:sigma-B regulation protein RsbU (phosphoserine phosphatase)